VHATAHRERGGPRGSPPPPRALGCLGEVEGLLDKLHNDASLALRRAYAPGSQPVLGSALMALAKFAAACPNRVLFLRPRQIGDMEAAAHNEWTFILLAQYLLSVPSKKTGKPVTVETAKSYLSLLKGYLSHSYAFDLLGPSTRLKRLLHALSKDPTPRNRKKRRGLRRRHLQLLWELREMRATDVTTVNNWALLVTAWHTLARGGELAPSVKPAGWNSDLHPSRADVAFKVTRSGRRYVVLWLRPLKKKGRGSAEKIPILIDEHDGGGSDAYWALRRLFELDPVAPHLRFAVPLFRRPSGQHVNVSQMRELVRQWITKVVPAPVVASQWGAHSCRVGGATDLASTGQASALVLQARGRWASDIGKIYARLTRRASLAASRLMQQGSGRDLEELFPAFTQPAF
jgi:hypothetical protein